MRLLNKSMLANIPTVDQGNLYLGENTASDARLALLAREQRKVQQKKDAQVFARRRAEYLAQRAQDAASARHAAMLGRSIRQTGQKEVAAIRRQGRGFTPQFGNNNPLMGFTDDCTVVDANFAESDVMNAQEFNNRLTAKDFKSYTKFKDYPLVMDAKGDFGGILTNEKGSADFSEWIVDDVRTDFGVIPRRALRRRR